VRYVLEELRAICRAVNPKWFFRVKSDPGSSIEEQPVRRIGIVCHAPAHTHTSHPVDPREMDTNRTSSDTTSDG
jgi:hypothetical protein